jgi:putative sterol carrier protein
VAELPPLSDAWITALDDVARRHDGLLGMASTVTLSVEYRVADGPTWHITLGDGEARVRPGPAVEPDVTFSTDRATATGLMTGSIDPLDAVITGDLSIGGDPRPLVEHHNLLATLGDVFAGVRAATESGT